EQFDKPGLDLEHNLISAANKIRDHIGIENLIAETLLTPDQQGSRNRAPVPARTRIGTKWQGRIGFKASLVASPSFGKFAQAEVRVAFIEGKPHVAWFHRTPAADVRERVLVPAKH